MKKEEIRKKIENSETYRAICRIVEFFELVAILVFILIIFDKIVA
jgi:hypothetical protein